MGPPGVEPADILACDGTKLPFVPDEDAVQALFAQGADEALDMRSAVQVVDLEDRRLLTRALGAMNIQQSLGGWIMF